MNAIPELNLTLTTLYYSHKALTIEEWLFMIVSLTGLSTRVLLRMIMVGNDGYYCLLSHASIA